MMIGGYLHVAMSLVPEVDVTTVDASRAYQRFFGSDWDEGPLYAH